MRSTPADAPAGGTHPRLRALDVRWMRRDDGRVAVLRDPFALGGNALAVPAAVTAILSLLDGTRDRGAVLRDAATRFGLTLDAGQLETVLLTLDDAFFLEGPRAQLALAERLQTYRRAPQRPPAHVGAAYPADPAALRQDLAAARRRSVEAGPGSSGMESRGMGPPPGDLAGMDGPVATDRQPAGILCPHIDFPRGGHVYARVWDAAREGLSAAKRVVVLGTDHVGRPGAVTLTRQHYATPLGVLTTDAEAVDFLAAAIGNEAAFADELHHATEHSVELAVVWLQEVLAGRSVPLVPILCGPLPEPAVGETEATGGPGPAFAAASGALADLPGAAETFLVVAGDLAHVGPAFGDPEALDGSGRRGLQEADRRILVRAAAGDADGLLDALRGGEADLRYCGAAPLYLALRAMAPVRGHLCGYDQCPADEDGGSLVTVAGMVFVPRQ
ncbi:MAG: AmmeMemoRadiSam system protein B, partial [Anaerolineae bacterium]